MHQRKNSMRNRRSERSLGRRATDASTLQLVREDERTHIARELHDDLGQLLATLRVDIARLGQLQVLPAAAAAQVLGLDKLLLTAITSMRRVARNLRPHTLDDSSLYHGLQAMCLDFARRHPLQCELDIVESELNFDVGYSTTVYRIVQESLTNVGRHAQARNVCVSVRRQDSMLHIRIEDDGIGLDAGNLHKPHSLGLIGMRERVVALNGKISVRGQGGTRITALLPLPV